ncbi:hypothetical protein EPL73_20880 [Clostridioides difficile]|nr:hypothetical protein [Clostridioides difficile]
MWSNEEEPDERRRKGGAPPRSRSQRRSHAPHQRDEQEDERHTRNDARRPALHRKGVGGQLRVPLGAHHGVARSAAEAAVRHQLRQRRRADRLPREPQHIGVQQAGDAPCRSVHEAGEAAARSSRRCEGRTGSLHRVVA